jgi:hypothetical protein
MERLGFGLVAVIVFFVLNAILGLGSAVSIINSGIMSDPDGLSIAIITGIAVIIVMIAYAVGAFLIARRSGGAINYGLALAGTGIAASAVYMFMLERLPSALGVNIALMSFLLISRKNWISAPMPASQKIILSLNLFASIAIAFFQAAMIQYARKLH